MQDIILPPEFKYQEYGRMKMAKRGRTGLISKPGTGKTRMMLGAIDDRGCLRGSNIITCSGPAVGTWEKEIPKWLGNSCKVYTVSGHKPKERHELWNHARLREPNSFFICNYNVFRIDFGDIYGPQGRKAGHWESVLADEYHKAFRRRKSQTFAKYKQLTQFIDVHIAASGTSMGRLPSSLFTLLATCDRRTFSSYWKFVNAFCLQIDGFHGREEVGVKPSALEAFKGIIDRYIAYIPPEVTADELPNGVRSAYDVKMTPKQAKVYNDFAADMYTQINDDIIMSGSTLDLAIKLQKVLCCPKLIDPSLDMGGGYEAILDTLDVQPHVIIFVPFREAVDIIVDQLKIDMKTDNVFALKGQIGSDETKRRVNEFRRTKGIIVSTIAYGESWDAETSDTTFFMGYSKDTGQLQQCEGRTQRAISGHTTIHWKYIRNAGSVDEVILRDIATTFDAIKHTMARSDAFINALKGVTNG